MDIESHSDSKESMDCVAQALMTIFSHDGESNEDHSLSLFLAKLYKNNVAAKPKRMNSIRLSRFNAFLYRVNLNYPLTALANSLIHNSLIAVLANDRNFLEEEDEEAVTSIGKWAAHILLRTIDRAFYDSAFTFLKYLVTGEKPQMDQLNGFEDLIRSEPYFADFELSCEDEIAAREQGYYSLTSAFSLKDLILAEIKIKEVYLKLFQNFPAKKETVRLFNLHLEKITLVERPSEIFIQVFLAREPESSLQIEAVLEALEQNYFNNQATIKALELLIRKQEKVALYFDLVFKDTAVEKLFLQLLGDFWKKRNIEILIEAFLAVPKVSNLAILYLLINSEYPIPKKYVYLPFEQGELQYQHTLIFALALAQYNDKKLSSELIDLYAKSENELSPLQRTLIVKAIHYLISNQDRKLLYSSIANQTSVAHIGGPPSLEFMPLGELKAERLGYEEKKKLLRLLEGLQDSSDHIMKIKAELLGLCNYANSPAKRIKELNAIIQRPYEEMFKCITEDNIKRDPELTATLLMALNNKLFLTFVAEPRLDIVEEIISVYLDMHHSFGKSIGRLENEDRNSKKSHYYAAVFRYGLHSKQRLSSLTGEIGELLSGASNYRRVNGIDFSDYLIREEEKRGLVAELWTGKKIVVELRKFLESTINFNLVNSEQKKELKGILDSEWAFPLAFEVIRTYFEAEVDDPPVLTQLLATFHPSYEFFEKVERLYSTQYDEYADILYFTPELLKAIYPDMLAFLAQLVESAPAGKKDKDKKEKKSSKKKKNEKEKAEKKGPLDAVLDHIFDNNALFETVLKRKELRALFGDPELLPNFAPLIKVTLKINDQFNRLEKIVNEWFPTIKVFHCQKPEELDDWVSRVASYCDLWNLFLVQKKFKFDLQELERHFHILSEFLNALYESKRPLPEVEEKILMTLLAIYQASSTKTAELPEVPAEALKNFFLGYRLSSPNDQHYYQCFTCNLPICQICMPFLHKHHDVNYLGKDGYCVHDANQKRKGDEEKLLREGDRIQKEGERIQREIDRYQNLGSGSVFQPSSYSQAGLMRNPRREEDWLMSTFEFPDEEMDFGQHLRFKEIMELRLREQRDREREKEKELLFSRERERMEREREEILSIFEKAGEAQEDRCELRSCSSKSIKNLHYGHSSQQYFTPEFAPFAEASTHYPSSINTKPLRCILLRELQSRGGEEMDKLEKGKVSVQYHSERYNFFNKSNYFKGNARPQFGMMRGMGLVAGTVKKSLLTSNNKFLAYPTPNNGVIFLVLGNMIAKMNKRIQNRAFNDFEQERGFLAGNINNSNFTFEPFQILFNKHNPNLLAIIGLTQLGFALVNNDAKLQKYADSDFKSSEPIIKFSWLSKHKNIFAVATGNSIRLGHVSDDGRVKTTNRFKVHIDKLLRDFEINNEGGSLFVYAIDNEGGFYRAEFDYRGAKALSISDRKLTYPENLEQLQSLLFADKRLLLSSSAGKCYLLNVANRNASPAFVQCFDLETALKASESTRFIKHPSYLSQLQLIQSSENLFSAGCILKRVAGDPKRKGGYLFVLRVNSKNSLEMILLSEEETIESYEVNELSENSYLITAVDENGSVFCFHYTIPGELFSLREDTKIPIDDNSIRQCNKLIRTHSLLALARYCEPKRYDNFKETKDLTANYRVTIDHPVSIKISTAEPFKYFWTGLAFTVEPAEAESNVSFYLFGQYYSFPIGKSREIQVPFNIKETVDIFTSEGEFSLFFENNSAKEIKNCRVYGLEYSSESLYKRAYVHLHKIVMTHLDFDPTQLGQYLENAERHSLATLDIARFADLKTANKYSNKELNLLMKLELLRESIDDSLRSENGLEETLDTIRSYILPQCEKRQYLEKSCWKLIRRVCQLGLPASQGVTGHPLEYRTVLDFYYFEVCLAQWSGSHQVSHFEQLVNLLYALIFKRIGNLYIIFKIYPDLIYELTYFYKNLLQSLKFSRNEARDQAQLQKLVNICPNFVALVCEYYQTLKNSAARMVEEAAEQEESPENIILSLLEEVFCATKKELYREVFISPEVYLEKLYLTPREPHPLSSAIAIFQIEDKKHDAYDLKKNCNEDAEEKSDEYLELEEESEKEVVLEEEAREMIEVSSEYQECSNEMQAEKLSAQEKFRKVHELLGSNLLPKGSQLQFIYYQFSFQMATALFSLDHFITEQNAVFYVGFLFNLLRILEMNLDPARDAVYLKDFFAAVHSKLYSEKHSVLYLVLNYFFEPDYQPAAQGTREVRPSPTKLSREFVKYLEGEGISIEEVFLQFEVRKTEKTVSFGEAMKFSSFSIENHLYQLKFLGNLYFSLRLSNARPPSSPAFKYKILGGVVRYKLRILSNIMYFENWQHDLEDARVEAGFETLRSNLAEGLAILSTCAKSQPLIFIKNLNANPEKIGRLEELLEGSKGESMQIIEMLTIYYSS